MQNKPNFGKAQMNVNVFAKKDYKNLRRLGLQKNKAKQTQFKPKQTQFPKRQNECKHL